MKCILVGLLLDLNTLRGNSDIFSYFFMGELGSDYRFTAAVVLVLPTVLRVSFLTTFLVALRVLME